MKWDYLLGPVGIVYLTRDDGRKVCMFADRHVIEEENCTSSVGSITTEMFILATAILSSEPILLCIEGQPFHARPGVVPQNRIELVAYEVGNTHIPNVDYQWRFEPPGFTNTMQVFIDITRSIPPKGDSIPPKGEVPERKSELADVLRSFVSNGEYCLVDVLLRVFDLELVKEFPVSKPDTLHTPFSDVISELDKDVPSQWALEYCFDFWCMYDDAILEIPYLLSILESDHQHFFVYAGYIHVEHFVGQLTQRGFKVEFENWLPYSDDHFSSQCVDISKLPQPLFS